MAFRLLPKLIITLACVITVTQQLPIRSKRLPTKGGEWSSDSFNSSCFREATYINVKCLVLLWDVSRRPLFITTSTNTPKRRRRHKSNDEEANESKDESEDESEDES